MVTSWDSAVDKDSEESTQQEIAGKKNTIIKYTLVNYWKHQIVRLENGRKSKLSWMLNKPVRIENAQTLVSAHSSVWSPSVKLRHSD